MADYILEPLDTDAEAIFQGFVEFVQIEFPDWEPSEGQLDIIIARYFSMQAAFNADMASRVQRAIYRYFGASLANIPPLPGSQARALIHFNIDDPSTPPIDRTLEFGTLVGLTDRDGDIQIFSLIDDLEITAGVTEGEVEAQATELGAVANGITGTVELIEMVDWISTASVVGASSGGSDPEDDDIYIQRLTANLALMAPRPILAEDFAVFAQNIPGVWRASVIDNFRPGVLEVQTLTSNYAAGTFKATFTSPLGIANQTAGIPAHATASQLRDAMGLLGNFDITDADFAGGPLGTAPITITYKGKYGYTDVAALAIDTSLLTGGSSFTVVQTTAGVAYGTDQENSVAVSAVDEAGNPLDPLVKQNLIDYLESTRSQNFVITFVDPAYHQVDITYVARALKYQDPDSVKSAVDTSFQDFLSPAKWGVYPYQSESRVWILQPTVRYLELTTVLENTPGVDYTQSLVFSLDGSAQNTSDKNFSGAFSLTRPGTINGTINLPI
jgi:hypothetical protein